MNIRRILVFALALMVMAMPAGLAEAGYAALTLSNIHLNVAGMPEPLDIDAALTIGVGAQEDGSGRLDIELIGGSQTAFSGSVGFDAEKAQAIVGGSSYYFDIPMAALEEMMAGAFSGDTSGVDMEAIKGMFEKYMKFLDRYADPKEALKLSAPVLAALNVEAKGAEPVELFGKQMELYRFDVSMDGKGIGEMYDAIFAADPDLKAFMTEYFTLIQAQSDEEFPIDFNDMGGSIAKGLEEAGVDMKIDMRIWTDAEDLASETSKAVKEDVRVTVVNLEPKGDAAESIEIPMTVSMLESDEGTRIAMDMHVAPEEGSLSMTFDATLEAPAADGGTESSGAFVMKFDSGDEDEAVDVTLDFAAATGADGVPGFKATLKGEGGGQAFDLGVGYEGATATETEQSGTVTLDFNIPEAGKGSLAFDVKVVTSAFKPLGQADFGGKTKVNPISEEDSELMEEAGVELNGVMMQALGVMMQTPGLSNIMGSMMNGGADIG